MNNFFIKITNSKIESSIARYLKHIINQDIKIKDFKDYIRKGGKEIVYLLGQDFKIIKDKQYLQCDGLKGLASMNFKKCVIFYIHSEYDLSEFDYLVDLNNLSELSRNINRAFKSQQRYDYNIIKEFFTEEYVFNYH